MATLALSRSAATPALPNPTLVAVALLCAIVLPNPVGYVGGGGDDWFYVNAARCIADNGWCVPTTHWAARWPLVAPMGAAFAALGDGWIQSTLVPLAYTLAAVALFVTLVEQAWGRGVAMVAGTAFVATASIAKGMLQPNVETVELAWLLGAAWAGRVALIRNDARLALVTGILLGVAMQARMTSLVWLPILAPAVALIPRGQRRLAAVAAIGVALPLLVEMLAYWQLAGDALLSQKLSAAHTRIASSELAATVDLTQSPLFNPAYIGGWSPAMDVPLHWTVQGVVNLLINPQMGPVLIAALVLLGSARKTLTWRSPEALLAVAATLYAGALIYGLAIDPKARMFLPVAAIAAVLVGKLGVASWQRGDKLFAGALVAMLIATGIMETGKRFDFGTARHLAAAWAAERPGRVAVEDATRRFLTFHAEIRALPVWPATDRSRVLVLQIGECREAAAAKVFPVLERSTDFGPPGDPLNLCEFSREDPAAPPPR